MKVWMLEWGGEGMPTMSKLFKEDSPPSMSRIREVLSEWEFGEYRLDDTIEKLKVCSVLDLNYEGLSLTLENVE